MNRGKYRFGILVLIMMFSFLLPPMLCPNNDSVPSLIYFDNHKYVQSETPICEVTWHSPESPNPSPLSSDSYVESDQIIVNATFQLSNEYLELNVVNSTAILDFDVNQNFTGIANVIGTHENDLTFHLNDFVWETINGIGKGDEISVTLNSSPSDCDVVAFWSDSKNETWHWSTDLLHGQMVSSESFEVGSFKAGRSGEIIFGVVNHEEEESPYILEIDNRISYTSSSNSIAFRVPNSDGTRPARIEFFGMVENGTVISKSLSNITFLNVFPPIFQTIDVTGASLVKTVTWSCYDRNSLDELRFDIYGSRDNNVTFHRLWTNLRSYHFDWDTLGWSMTNLTVKIIAIDPFGYRDEITSDYFQSGRWGHVTWQTTFIEANETLVDILIWEETQIEWTGYSYFGSYMITCNDTLLDEGTLNGDFHFPLRIKHDFPGLYTYKMTIQSITEVRSKMIYVRVHSGPLNRLILYGFLHGASIGTAIVLISGISLVIHKKLNPKDQKQLETD